MILLVDFASQVSFRKCVNLFLRMNDNKSMRADCIIYGTFLRVNIRQKRTLLRQFETNVAERTTNIANNCRLNDAMISYKYLQVSLQVVF